MNINTRIVASVLALSTAALFAAPASAGAVDAGPETYDLARSAFGAGSMDDMRALSETELGEARGGYGGVYFTLLGYGDFSNTGGQLPDGVSITSQSADLVSLNLGLATLPNSGGFVQFASVVGNNNIVNNNLILNVYFLEGGVADTSSIANGSAFGF